MADSVPGCLAGAADEEESLDVPTSTAVNKETAANRKLVTEPEEKPIDGVFDDANHIYYLKKANGKPCFVLKFDKADIEVEYYVKVFAGKSFKKGVASTKFSIPEGVRIYGICSDKTANNYLRLSWDRDQYTIELLTERISNASWNLNQVTFKYDTDDTANFPNVYEPIDLTASNQSTKIFANLKNTYQCEDLTMSLDTPGHPLKTALKFTGFKLYPLDIPALKDVNALEGRDCRGPRGPTKSPYDSSIPIVVGVCLAVLILAVILGYFVRERLRKPQYSIME